MPGRARQSLDPRSVVAWVYLKLHDAGSRTEPVRQSFEVLAAGGLHAPGASDPASPMGKIDAAWACIGVHGQKSPLDLFFAGGVLLPAYVDIDRQANGQATSYQAQADEDEGERRIVLAFCRSARHGVSGKGEPLVFAYANTHTTL